MRGALATCGLVALAALPSPASAARHLPAPEGAVRWLSPVAPAESDWIAGARSRFEWQPGPAFAALAGETAIVEWELFLSVDGGRTWSVRLTPHLEIARRSVTVEIPDLPSDDVRLLMRFGDERLEYDLDLPGRFRIARGSGARPARAPNAAWSFLPGERARPAASGATLWSEGPRSGHAPVWRWYPGRSDTLSRAHRSRWHGSPLLAPPEKLVRVRDLVARAPIDATRESTSGGVPATDRDRMLPIDLLRASCRRNT